MRGRVCSLQLLLGLDSGVFQGSELLGTHNHILLPNFLDSPNLEGQVPVFISPRNRITHLYHQILDLSKSLTYDTSKVLYAHTRSLSVQGWYSRLCPGKIRSRYNGSSIT
jgi:hypothetical protein